MPLSILDIHSLCHSFFETWRTTLSLTSGNQQLERILIDRIYFITSTVIFSDYNQITVMHTRGFVIMIMMMMMMMMIQSSLSLLGIIHYRQKSEWHSIRETDKSHMHPIVLHDHYHNSSRCSHSSSVTANKRRQVLTYLTSLAISSSFPSFFSFTTMNWSRNSQAHFGGGSSGNEIILRSATKIYAIQTNDVSMLPSIQRFGVKEFIHALIRDQGSKKQKKRVIFLGEHHPNSRDHRIQSVLIQCLYDYTVTQTNNVKKKKKIPLAVGMEAIQQQFQSVLNDYIAGHINEKELITLTDWEKKWSWSFNPMHLFLELVVNLAYN